MRIAGIIFGLWLAVSSVWAEDAAPLRVGVIGTITALDPVQINGLTLEVGEDTPVLSPLGPRNGLTLRVGHTMAVTLEVAGDGWDIKRLLHVYPLIGPVSTITDGTLDVMGSIVVAGSPATFEGISAGNWVGISGLWRGEQLIASRAGAISATGFAQLSGSYVAAEEETGNPKIGGTEINGPLPAETDTADMWVLSGTPSDTALKILLSSPRLFVGEVDMVLAQGFASAPIASETFMLLGTGLIGHAKDSDMPRQDSPIIRCAIGRVILQKPPEEIPLAELASRLGCFGPAQD